MFSINQFLSRFKNVSNTEKNKKELMVGIFYEYNIPITIPQITFLRNKIFLKAKPIIKTEIFIKKDEILKKIQNLPGCEFFSELY